MVIRDSLNHNLSESYPAAASSIPAVRAAVTDFAWAAGAMGSTLDAVRLAVTEAATNAVLHAYRGSDGTIHLTAAVVADELWVLVSDDGCGFLHAVPGTPGLGWGLALIADACPQFEISERAAGGTELRMHFPLGR